MPTADRRAAARRKAWGRGPMILRFEPLERRQLLTDGVVPIMSPGTSASRPDLVLTAFDTLHNLDYGDPFNAVGRVENLGTAEAPAGVEVDVYASTTPSLGPNAVYVGTATLDEPIAPGGQATFREPLHAPPAAIPGLGTATSYYFVAKVDPQNRVNELDETNNGGLALDPSSLVTITPRPLAVLSPGPVTVTPGTLTWGSKFDLVAQVANQSGAVVPGGRARVVLAAAGQPLDGAGAVTIGELTVPDVGVAQITQVAGSVTLPEHPPGPLAGASRFTVGLLADAGTVEAYLGAAPLQIAPGVPLADTAKPDVAVVSLQPLDTELTWSVPFRVKATVENDGAAATGPLRVTFALVDARRPDLAPLAVADAVLPDLQPGYRQEILQTIDLNGKLPVGLDPATVDGRIVVRVDPENAIDERNEADNLLVSTPVILKLLTRDGRLEAPKPGPVTTPPAAPTPTPPPPTGQVDPPNRPRPVRPQRPQPPTRPERPTREQLAERMELRRAMLTLRTQQRRLGLRVFRDLAHAAPPAGRPHLDIPPPTGPKAS